MIKRVFSWMWSKKWWTLGTLVLLAFVAYFVFNTFIKTPENTDFVSNDYLVSSGMISNTLSMAGTTKFANAQKLTFVNKGKVISVKVKVGDTVKKDQVLASISTDDLDQEVEQKKRALKSAQRKLKTYMETSDKGLDLLKAQAALDELVLEQALLPQTQALKIEEMQLSIKDKEVAVKEAQNDYDLLVSGKKGVTNPDLAVSTSVRDRNEKFENLVRDFRTQASTLEDKLDAYDNLVKETDKFQDPSSYQYLYIGANNSTLLNQSKEGFWKLKKYVTQLNDLYTYYNAIPVGQLTEDQILSGYQVFKTLGKEFSAWGATNYKMILESKAFEGTSTSLTKATIVDYAKRFGTSYEDDGYKFGQVYTNAVSTLKGIKESDTDQETLKTKLDKLKIELERLKNDLEIAKKNQLVQSAEKSQAILKAKETVATLASDAENPEELQSLKDSVEEAQDALSTALKRYEDYRIIANFDGVVTKVEMQVGDSINSNSSTSTTEKYIYVETPNLLEVKLDVDQTDIVKIAMGMPVQVMVDAFSDEVFTGVISEIDTMVDGNNYSAKVVFQKHSEDQKILGGMSATVKITLQEILDTIVVPNPAIADDATGGKIVKLKQGNQWIDRVVEVGIADDANTQILSGLRIGDTIKGLYINDISLQNSGVGETSSDSSMVMGGPGGPRRM